jgi:hypothetical protein
MVHRLKIERAIYYITMTETTRQSNKLFTTMCGIYVVSIVLFVFMIKSINDRLNDCKDQLCFQRSMRPNLDRLPECECSNELTDISVLCTYGIFTLVIMPFSCRVYKSGSDQLQLIYIVINILTMISYLIYKVKVVNSSDYSDNIESDFNHTWSFIIIICISVIVGSLLLFAIGRHYIKYACYTSRISNYDNDNYDIDNDNDNLIPDPPPPYDDSDIIPSAPSKN